MITIKLPYATSEECQDLILNLRQQQSCVVRYAFNRFQEGLKDTPIRHKIKSEMKNIGLLNAWMIDSAILEAKTIYSSKKGQKVLFGEKYNWKRFVRENITKEEFKEKRLQRYCVTGSKEFNGNRNFKLDFDNNQILFKYDRKNHLSLNINLPRGKYLQQLKALEVACLNKEKSFQIKLDDKFIYISFEPEKIETKLIKNRVFSIDMNPNNLGYSVLEFDKNDNFKVIETGIINNKKINDIGLKGLASTDKKSKYVTNKRRHEILQISNFLAKKAKHYGCSKFVIEDLTISNKNHQKGKRYNKLINNQWCRTIFESNLQKHCGIYNIEFIKVNPAYSSFVGNLVYNYPDPICSAIELGRRGYKKFVKGWFYPELIVHENLPNQWKEEVDSSYKSWVELFNRIKKVGLSYHFSWEDTSLASEFFRFKSKKSMVEFYST
jgi:IS605 OrfB family transposase